MPKPIKSRRGVYYDLEKSPYEYQSPYGDTFKFRSEKRLEIYARDVKKEIQRLDVLIQRNDLHSFIPDEIKQLLERMVYQAFYKKTEE